MLRSGVNIIVSQIFVQGHCDLNWVTELIIEYWVTLECLLLIDVNIGIIYSNFKNYLGFGRYSF